MTFIGGLILGGLGSVFLIHKIVEYDIRRNSLTNYTVEDYFPEEEHDETV